MQMHDTAGDIAALITAAGGAFSSIRGSAPAGVTPANPYAPPSGLALPAGVTAGYQPQYGYPAPTRSAGFLGLDPMTLAMIAFGGVAVLLLVMKR